MRRRWQIISGFIIVLLSACQPAAPQPAAPVATRQYLTVEYTPALSPLQPIFFACAQQQNGLGVIPVERAASALNPAPDTLSLRWDEPPALQGYAAIIGSQELTIIVHPQNPLAALNRADLQAVYAGERTQWNELLPEGAAGALAGREIHVWRMPASEDAQQVLEATLLQQPPDAAVTWLAPDAQAMRQAVAEDPAAVGFLPTAWLDATVRALPISDVDAAALRRPVLALSPQEPQGAARGWLLCMQAALQK